MTHKEELNVPVNIKQTTYLIVKVVQKLGDKHMNVSHDFQHIQALQYTSNIEYNQSQHT